MKKSALTLFLLIIGLASFSSGAETRVLNIKQSFSSLEASAGVKIIYQPTTGGQRTVKIDGETNRINQVDVRISGKTLKISPKKSEKNGWMTNNRIKGVVITVTAPMVDEIEASSGASVRCNSVISHNGKKIEIDVSSGASVSLRSVNCRKFEADASSGANISVKALNADRAEFDVSSGAGISATSVTTKDIDCDASSGGSIKLAGTATKGSFSASSGGSIKGSAFTVNNSRIDKSIGGSVRINSKN